MVVHKFVIEKAVRQSSTRSNSVSSIVNVAFRETEDLLADPTRALFGLPIDQLLSPGRTAALDNFLHKYLRITWRVRVADGWSHTSGWSPPVTAGPESGGVPG